MEKKLVRRSIEIRNFQDLQKLIEIIFPFLQPNSFLLLQGSLGIGKTTFTQLLAKKLGIKEKVSSPTFTVFQQYTIEKDYKLNHFDFFRLSPKDDLNIFQELTFDNLNVIEWPENNPQFWQEKQYIHLTFDFSSLKKQIRMVKIDLYYTK